MLARWLELLSPRTLSELVILGPSVLPNEETIAPDHVQVRTRMHIAQLRVKSGGSASRIILQVLAVQTSPVCHDNFLQ